LSERARTLDRDGVQIYYEVHGPKADEARATVLLTHGFSATSRMWTPQLKALTEQYQLVIWDMRGHGKSDSPADLSCYNEALTVRDMAALLDAIDVQSAVIGGLSLGGYMSLAFAMTYPERTRALMVFDTGPGYRRDAPRDGWNRSAVQTAKALEKKGFDGLTSSSAEVASAQHDSAEGLARAARGMLTQTDAHIIEGLAELAMPTLVLAGELDEPFLAATDYMARKIPGAARVILEGAGHAANLDRPKGFNAVVQEFLDRAV
tara:strand:+ start:322 stop:1110 length:789 start_codon:yes stop_codon:yes gene_type:complete